MRPWSSPGGREPLSCSRYWCPGSFCRRAPSRLAPRSADRRSQGRNGHHGHRTGPEADPRGKRLRRTRAQGRRIARRQGRHRDRYRTRGHEVRYVYSHARRRKPGLCARPAYGRRILRGPGRSGGWRSRSLRGTNDVRQEPLLQPDQRHVVRPRSLLLQVQARQRRLQLHTTGTPFSDMGRHTATHRGCSTLARIRAYRSGGSSQSWADWTPRVDWYGGTARRRASVFRRPSAASRSRSRRCPNQVTFKKSANGTQPDYTQTWFGLGTRGNRELNFEIAVRVTQGGTASFAMPAARPGKPLLGNADARPDPAHGNGCTPGSVLCGRAAGRHDPESRRSTRIP